jgi:hypothetical protein
VGKSRKGTGILKREKREAVWCLPIKSLPLWWSNRTKSTGDTKVFKYYNAGMDFADQQEQGEHESRQSLHSCPGNTKETFFLQPLSLFIAHGLGWNLARFISHTFFSHLWCRSWKMS